MTVYQSIFALVAVFMLIGIHQAAVRMIALLDGHLERFQGKLDVLLAAETEQNEKLDVILHKLF